MCRVCGFEIKFGVETREKKALQNVFFLNVLFSITRKPLLYYVPLNPAL